MSHDPHLGFIVAAYVFAFAIVAGMTGAILADYLRLRQALASFAVQERPHDQGLDGSSRQAMAADGLDPEGSD